MSCADQKPKVKERETIIGAREPANHDNSLLFLSCFFWPFLPCACVGKTKEGTGEILATTHKNRQRAHKTH